MSTSKINLNDLSESEIYWACVAADAADTLNSIEAKMFAAGPAGVSEFAKAARDAQAELEHASEKCVSIWDRMELDVFAIRAARNEWCAKLAAVFAPAFAE